MTPAADHDHGPAVAPAHALAALWQGVGLPTEALGFVSLTGTEPVLPSSFAVGTAAQSSLAAAALAAAELWHLRVGERQHVSVPMQHAALECCAHFLIDGVKPQMWDKLSGLYRCGDGGWVRIHANFAHHRDGALRLLGCPVGPDTERSVVEQALRAWQAQHFEQAAAEAGLVVAALRSFAEWDAHPQAQALRVLPIVSIERIGDAQALRWPALPQHARPLHGLRVLDLTRILAGPVAGRLLAAYGAEVMLVNGPQLPNIDAIADTSRGKLSCHVDLRKARGQGDLQALLRQSHVFLQGYRPGALVPLGFAPQALARSRPGIVCVSLSAYGHEGPWAARRGFDSLVQTATGFNEAEARAAGSARPQAMPMQVLDYAAGHLLAFGAQAALWRQAREGGSWHVQVSLAGVGHWLRSLGRVTDGLQAKPPVFDDELMQTTDSGFGRLTAMRHAAQFSITPAGWDLPSMPPGTHAPAWPQHLKEAPGRPKFPPD
jgi:crotonobetainyl-CoA:carnitine CoA-transferase CaiB-like acyl-CoA transferase